MAKTASVARCAVIGNPIAHSQSPEIHAQFARNTGLSVEYERILATPETFAAEVARFFDEGGRGLNVTLPFKEAAAQLAQQKKAAVEESGAANTLWRDREGRLVADNTDGQGLLNALGSQGVELAGARVLVLGAGGAARGVLWALKKAGAELAIANRTVAKAQQLAAEQGGTAYALDAHFDRAFDVLINATSAGLSGEEMPFPTQALDAHSVAMEMVYGQETPFMHWARAAGARLVLDGYPMLVEQARLSFARWFHVLPRSLL